MTLQLRRHNAGDQPTRLRRPTSAWPHPVTSDLTSRLHNSRRRSIALATPLSDEDQTVQATDDASPAKWHLAHTTWFYEAFVLRPHVAGYQSYSDQFDYCFNSYYESEGQRLGRARRGLLSRPSAAEVRNYRVHVDAVLDQLLAQSDGPSPTAAALIELGINHEQQHQELLLMDILALFAANPLRPAYGETSCRRVPADTSPQPLSWISFAGGIGEVGHAGPGFSYDNETPRHQVLTHPFALSDRCITNAEWQSFMADGGYRNPLLWLADGWATVQREGWTAPGYWEQVEGIWHQMTLAGRLPVEASAPVCHISYYEADAYARWAGKRLPTEFEWETAAETVDLPRPESSQSIQLHPLPATTPAASTLTGGLRQMFGDVWQWTASAYLPYPGFAPPAGAVGEYNGKFMCSQQVLRGASFATPAGHARTTYRNFFYPVQRWQFAGLRLARDEA